MNYDKWLTGEGKAFVDGDFEGVPQKAGIYIWKRIISIPDSVRNESKAFTEWITSIIETPIGLLENKYLTDIITLMELRFGGKPLSETKQNTLRAFSKSPNNRSEAVRFIKSLNAFTPPLYIGETNNLQRRFKDHLAADSDLTRYIQKLGMDWQDLSVKYITITDQQVDDVEIKEKLEFFEMISQRMLGPFGTRRSG